MMSNVKVEQRTMLLYDFVRGAQFTDPDYPADITADMMEHQKNVHPNNMIAFGEFEMSIYQVKYSCECNCSGKKKEYQKFMFFDKEEFSDNFFEVEIMIQSVLDNYVTRFNVNYPHKAVSNVHILEVLPVANASFSLN